MPDKMIGEIAGLGAAVASGLTGIVVKGMGVRLSPQATNAARCTFAALMFLPIVLLVEGPPNFAFAATVWVVGSVLFSIVIGDTALFSAISMIGASRAVPIAQAYPVFAVGMAAFALGEPLSAPKILGAIIAVTGTAFISMRSTAVAADESPARFHWRGVGLAALAAVSWSIGLIAMRQSMHSFGIWQTATIRMFIGAAILWPLAWKTRSLPSRADALSPSTVVFAATIGGLLCLSTIMLVVCVSAIGAGSAAIFSSMAPIVTVPLGWLLFKEPLTKRIFIGIVLVIGGGSLCVAS